MPDTNQSAPEAKATPSTPPPPQGSFWSRNSKNIIRVIVVVAIIAAAYFYSHRSDVTINNESATDQEQMENDDSSSLNVIDQTQSATGEVMAGTMDNTQTVAVTRSGDITVTAVRGNGYTHLARKALAEYLKGREIVLRPEHKIFIEDYLQKNLTNKPRLYAGNQVSFSQNLIQQAIDASLKLSDAQIQNLSRYVPLVPGI